jgi:hypothetical protein
MLSGLRRSAVQRQTCQSPQDLTELLYRCRLVSYVTPDRDLNPVRGRKTNAVRPFRPERPAYSSPMAMPRDTKVAVQHHRPARAAKLPNFDFASLQLHKGDLRLQLPPSGLLAMYIGERSHDITKVGILKVLFLMELKLCPKISINSEFHAFRSTKIHFCLISFIYIC